jgi:hypothetical protein
MLLFGVRSKIVKNLEHPGVLCPSCGKENGLQSSVLIRYVHFFRIPFFPLQKKGVCVCKHCRRAVDQKEAVSGPVAERQGLLRGGYPVWMFSGSALILFALSGFFLSGFLEARKLHAYLRHPQPEDCYEIKTVGGYYTLMKVSRFTEDSVWFLLNKYESNKLPEMLRLDGDTNYFPQEQGYSVQELDTMRQNGSLLKIHRLR